MEIGPRGNNTSTLSGKDFTHTRRSAMTLTFDLKHNSRPMHILHLKHFMGEVHVQPNWTKGILKCALNH